MDSVVIVAVVFKKLRFRANLNATIGVTIPPKIAYPIIINFGLIKTVSESQHSGYLRSLYVLNSYSLFLRPLFPPVLSFHTIYS
jgi:hypothetical protein